MKRATGAALPVVRERKPGKAAVLVGRASGLSGFTPNEARVAVKDGAPVHGYAPDSVFYFDCTDDEGAGRFLKKHGLERGKFVCAIPGNRVTPRWEFWGKKPNEKGVALNAKTEESGTPSKTRLN